MSPLNMYVPVKTQISNWLLAAQAVHQKDFKKLHVAWWVSWDEPLEPPTQVSKRDFNSKSFYFSPCQIATDPSQQPQLSQPPTEPSANFPPAARVEWKEGTPLDEIVPNLPTLPWIFEIEWAFLYVPPPLIDPPPR